jgi:formylglycine-generating enzyme required for sulfatase activity
MVWVPAGQFAMGDNDDAIRDRVTGLRNNPRHTVYLAGYYISRNLVTVGQYRNFCRATHHQMPLAPPWGWQDDHPVVNVSWDDARAYCDWAGLRLPTEAEWEKAARGPSGNRYPWGDTFDPARLAFGNANGGGTAPAGVVTEGASPYGALDMAGNVWEWCADWYDASYLTAHVFGSRPQPRRRVLRGGSWHDEDASIFRSAYRSKTEPQNRSNNIGFRTVSEPW